VRRQLSIELGPNSPLRSRRRRGADEEPERVEARALGRLFPAGARAHARLVRRDASARSSASITRRRRRARRGRSPRPRRAPGHAALPRGRRAVRLRRHRARRGEGARHPLRREGDHRVATYAHQEEQYHQLEELRDHQLQGDRLPAARRPGARHRVPGAGAHAASRAPADCAARHTAPRQQARCARGHDAPLPDRPAPAGLLARRALRALGLGCYTWPAFVPPATVELDEAGYVLQQLETAGGYRADGGVRTGGAVIGDRPDDAETTKGPVSDDRARSPHQRPHDSDATGGNEGFGDSSEHVSRR
jgi:hypothetical protein